jgi:hypothetical protein
MAARDRDWKELSGSEQVLLPGGTVVATAVKHGLPYLRLLAPNDLQIEVPVAEHGGSLKPTTCAQIQALFLGDQVLEQIPEGFLVRSATLHHVHKTIVDKDTAVVSRGELVARHVVVVGFHSRDVRLPVAHLFELTGKGLGTRTIHQLGRPKDGTRMDTVWAEDAAYTKLQELHHGHEIVPQEFTL